jgi:hypothetical protein
MLAVLVAIIRVVGRCLGFFIYVWSVAPCITADEVPQPATIQTENRELENYRKFSLQLSEVGHRLKWSHNECKIDTLAGLQWCHNECSIGTLADKFSAGCHLDRHVATWSVLCVCGAFPIPALCRLSCTGTCGSPCTLHLKLDIVTKNAMDIGNCIWCGTATYSWMRHLFNAWVIGKAAQSKYMEMCVSHLQIDDGFSYNTCKSDYFNKIY